MTYKASRAYEIAREFRKRNIPTIMGGIHASMCPDEAMEHVDSVVIGEADELWCKILEDVEKGRLQPQYQAVTFPDVTRIPPPRHDLTSHRQYLSFILQTTRGCPNACDFCTVSSFNGRALRRKTPKQVIREVESVLTFSGTPVRLRSQGLGLNARRLAAAALFFSDDNFAINRAHAMAVCDALKRYQEGKGILINWFTQVDMQASFDNELLEAMSLAGCFSVFIGFESLNIETLKAMKKRKNSPERYPESIANVRRHGMEVYYSTIVGGESDTSQVGEELVEFVEKHALLYVWPNILTPHFGTPLRRSMEEAGRIVDRNTDKYGQTYVVFNPRVMSADTLQVVYQKLCQQLYDIDKSLLRATRLLESPRLKRITLFWRLAFYVWFLVVLPFLVVTRKTTFRVFLKMLRVAHRFFLGTGTLHAVDSLIYCLEQDRFARLQKAPWAE